MSLIKWLVSDSFYVGRRQFSDFVNIARPNTGHVYIPMPQSYSEQLWENRPLSVDERFATKSCSGQSNWYHRVPCPILATFWRLKPINGFLSLEVNRRTTREILKLQDSSQDGNVLGSTQSESGIRLVLGLVMLPKMRLTSGADQSDYIVNFMPKCCEFESFNHLTFVSFSVYIWLH